MNLSNLAICSAIAVSFSVASVEGREYSEKLQEGFSALNSQDYGAAADAFQRAFDDGDADGAFFLGRMLELGIGGSANLPAAVGLYRAASELGSPPALNRLGVLHIQGRGLLQDYAEGARLVCLSAENGDSNGAHNCGTVLLQGVGTGRDEAMAYEWFGKAAEQGHVAGMNALAAGLIAGSHIPKDVQAAFSLLEQSAASGDASGLFALAQLQASGIVGDPDLIEAHKNFNVAAALGHPQAPSARADLEAGMSAGDIALAQERARNWKPKQTTSKYLVGEK